MGKRAKRAKRETIRQLLARVNNDLQSLTVSELQSVERYKKLREEILAHIRASTGPADDRYTYRRSEIARIFRITERTVTRWSKQGKLPQSHSGKWDIREVIHVLQQRLEEELHHTGQTPEERKDLARAQILELDLAERTKELVSREAVARMIGPALAAIRSTILSIPDHILQYIPTDQRADARRGLQEAALAILAELKEAFEHAVAR